MCPPALLGAASHALRGLLRDATQRRLVTPNDPACVREFLKKKNILVTNRRTGCHCTTEDPTERWTRCPQCACHYAAELQVAIARSRFATSDISHFLAEELGSSRQTFTVAQQRIALLAEAHLARVLLHVGDALPLNDRRPDERIRVRFQIFRNARILNVGKSQSCMVSKLRIIWKQTVYWRITR